MRRELRIFGRTLVLERGGQDTQWPWTSLTLSRQRPTPHVCGSSRRRVEDPGWRCDGTKLVEIGGDSGPMVVDGRPVVVRVDQRGERP